MKPRCSLNVPILRASGLHSSSDRTDIEEEFKKMNEGKELIKALDDIEKEKGISKDILLEAIENSLVAA